MRHGQLAPCAGLESLSTSFDPADLPFHFPRQAQEWSAGARGTRTAGINSFGMGGSNAFLVVESGVKRTLRGGQYGDRRSEAADALRREHFVHCGSECPFAFEEACEFGGKGASRALASQEVERAIFGCGHQPSRGILGHAAEFPDLERAAEGVLHDVFCQREVVHPEDARERGDHAPGFAPKEMIAGFHHMFICRTGRTSTAPSNSKIGQPLESSTAWSRSRASMRE